MKLFKKSIILLLICILITGCFSSIPVYASETEDYKSFSQVDERWANFVYDSGHTIGSSGCVITSLAVLMAYANPNLRDVSTFNPKILSQKLKFSGGGIYWDSTTYADSTFKIVGGGKQYSGNALSESYAREKVKELYNNGYYVLICCVGMYTSGCTHYSPVLGFDEDKPIVWDVAGGANSSWDTWAGTFGITEIVAYKSSIQDSNKAMRNNSVGSTQANGPQTEEEKEALYSIIKEWDLRGMPGYIDYSNGSTEVPDIQPLSEEDQQKVELAKENIKSRKTDWSSVGHASVSFVGITLMFYGVLLLICGIFDISNQFLEISLLSVISFGKFRLLDDSMQQQAGYHKELKTTYLTKTMLIQRFIVLEIAGLILVSGVIFKWLITIIDFVRGLL